LIVKSNISPFSEIKIGKKHNRLYSIKMASQQVTETPTNVTGQQEEPKEFFAITPLATCPHIDNLSVFFLYVKVISFIFF
jgi:hypothetical protein